MELGQFLVTEMQGAVVMVVTQVAFAGPTWAPVHRFVPVAVAVFVKGPQEVPVRVFVAVHGLLPPTAIVSMAIVLSSAALPGVPLSSTTFTPVSGTLPQLVTTPLTT